MNLEGVGVEGSVAARFACLNLIHAYNNLADAGQHVLIADLFTECAVMHASGEEMTGVEAIRAGMRRRAAANRRTVHVTANVQFSGDSGDSLKAVSTVLVTILADEPKQLSPSLMARADDEFVRLPSGEWRFSRRVLDTFARAG